MAKEKKRGERALELLFFCCISMDCTGKPGPNLLSIEYYLYM